MTYKFGLLVKVAQIVANLNATGIKSACRELHNNSRISNNAAAYRVPNLHTYMHILVTSTEIKSTQHIDVVNAM